MFTRKSSGGSIPFQECLEGVAWDVKVERKREKTAVEVD